MVIHTVKPGETLYKISKIYGVSPTKIIENNGLCSPDRLSVGKKLLILTPTKTYTVRGGDTLEKISRRFGISERELKRRNPYLSERRGIYAEQVIAIRHDTPQNSSAIINGYYYKDTPSERLSLALSVADVISVSAYTVRDGGLKRIFNDAPVVKSVRDAKRSPVMRIYAPDRADVLLKHKDTLSKEIVEAALSRGYDGICLSAWSTLRDNDGHIFLASVKDAASKASLPFALECDGAIDEISGLADSFVLQYEKCVFKDIPSFEEGEAKFYLEYAAKCEPQRTFIDIPSLGYIGDDAASFDEIDSVAYRYGKKILYDEEKKICYFDLMEKGRSVKRAVMEAPENIKAKLGLLSSLGYMGMSFDIMRMPVAYLMMATYLFADTYPSSAEI